MAEPPRSRKTGEHNGLIVKLMADGAAMREQIDALEARILRLEAEVATARKNAIAAQKSVPRVSVPPVDVSSATAAVAGRASKRPGPVGPPPLPRLTGSMAAPRPGARRSFVDISDVAELVESLPPPSPRSKR